MTRRLGSDTDESVADLKADFLARLEYGLNPVVGSCGIHQEHAQDVGQSTFPCHNGSGAGIADNESRRLDKPRACEEAPQMPCPNDTARPPAVTIRPAGDR